jgi:hypothetical protein
VADPWQAIEACFAQEWTDGLPVGASADEVLLHEPVRDRTVSAWHAAINAVMAGCRPEYFPVVGATAVITAIGD